MDETKMDLQMVPPPGMDPDEDPPPNFMDSPKRESDASTITRRYLDSILIEERLIGADAYKALALGAAGRVLIPLLMKSGAEGVEKYVTKMNNELRMLMGFTGRRTLSDMGPDVLWQNGKRMGT